MQIRRLWTPMMVMVMMTLAKEAGAQMPADTIAIPAVSAIQLKTILQNDTGVLVVNFWSTWCKPCIEEIPHFIATIQSFKERGAKLLLVSLDTKTLHESGALQNFMRKKQWQVPALWLHETDADYYTSVLEPRWSGVLPSTMVIHRSKKYYRFYEESLSAAQLAQAIQLALQ